MELLQTQRAEQKLALTQGMRQSLEILQMSLPELASRLQEAALSNPLMELEYPARVMAAPQDGAPDTGDDSNRASDPQVSIRSRDGGRGRSAQAPALENLSVGNEENFYEMLRGQLIKMKWLDEALIPLCGYIIDCLDERGYLRFDVRELAREQRVPPEQMAQALYVVQSLQPVGVGARTLEECLILQLSQTDDFCEETLHLVQGGLELLAKRDYRGLAAFLHCSRARAEEAAQVIRGLNPIPSQGYDTGEAVQYQIPEATVTVENGALVLEMNHEFLPRVRLDKGNCELLRQSGEKANLDYLKQHTAEANQLIQCVENRESTVRRLLTLILEDQQGYFLRGEPLRPVTMSALAQRAGVSSSTVSRALQGKTVLFGGRTMPIKEFFSTAVTGGAGVVSAQEIRQRLGAFIAAEDAAHPLSDEELSGALAAVQLPISRRTVAKYRESMGIATASKRKKH